MGQWGTSHVLCLGCDDAGTIREKDKNDLEKRWRKVRRSKK